MKKKYMKIKFNSDNQLPLNKKIETHTMVKIIGAFFLENNKYYPQVLLDKCLYKMESKDKLKEVDIKNPCVIILMI